MLLNPTCIVITSNIQMLEILKRKEVLPWLPHFASILVYPVEGTMGIASILSQIFYSTLSIENFSQNMFSYGSKGDWGVVERCSEIELSWNFLGLY